MVRVILFVLTLVGPALMLVGAAGCEEKTVTVQESQQRHESEPQMVSPGKEKVE
jgi:hypothetical protein